MFASIFILEPTPSHVQWMSQEFLLKKSDLNPTSSALVSTVSLKHGAYLSFSQLAFFAGGYMKLF
jgi:hypothetical protein